MQVLHGDSFIGVATIIIIYAKTNTLLIEIMLKYHWILDALPRSKYYMVILLFWCTIMQNKFILSHRIIISAPNGTAPGSTLSNLGLVFTCPVDPTAGGCEGLQGDSGDTDRRLFDTDGGFHAIHTLSEQESSSFSIRIYIIMNSCELD